LLHLPIYKRPPEGEHRAFALEAFCLGPLLFALGLFGVEALGREKIAEGKRIAKEGLIESLHREL
jgi:hypothetical protein